METSEGTLSTLGATVLDHRNGKAVEGAGKPEDLPSHTAGILRRDQSVRLPLTGSRKPGAALQTTVMFEGLFYVT